MKKLGIVVFGETDHVSYCNTVEEAHALAKQGTDHNSYTHFDWPN